ncbi:septal ring lytic transglycosylase RlpA family protein [Synechococcus sp. PCC 6312]|uniref:septal ring lytic transglycosylase RlpA family protein n=1 Tax=Synechococcus sp. (strain ATCC 27167 / PCC 6312) TaxID=195253 RepID=UPI00029F4D62|nr:septal ring lytic transglycosylase RlpA family protein [Synechococcus sp. PCC 6312]AFY61271.1 rare lipoprotein A [Synechococcus sp. PCC 6312]
MNQKNLILGMATTVLAILGFLPWSEATPERSPDSQPSQSLASASVTPAANSIADSAPTAATISGQSAPQASDNSAATATTIRPIATTLIHDLNGREVVTLYLRGIPAMTFLGSQASPPSGVQVASAANLGIARNAAPITAVVQANQLAERLNQLHTSGVDAKTIRLAWNPNINSYRIYAGQDPRQDALVTVNSSVIFPQGGKNLSKDALQITNLIRRQLGNAPALTTAEGRNYPTQTRVATSNFNSGAVRSLFTGMASWYGPGFHGARTSSGERFDQYAMTAAHKTLPFGTMVRVTNLNNGRSVLVRINDRGPFTPGRVIDLSRGAAEVIGLVSSGVGSVRIEVME